MSTTTPKLTSGAMSVDIAKEGQRTVAAPLGHALLEAAREDERIVGLSADLAKYTDLHILRDAMPERFYQIGMAEQALLGAATGLAMEGFIPFASTYSVFATRRAYDFLCLDIAEADLNVNMVCALPGLTTGYGPSHQATEDVAILRGMPNLTIVDPCDAIDIQQAVPQLAASDGPTYMRLLRGKVPAVLDEYGYSFELGKATMIREGGDVLIISTGLMTERALEAAAQLEKDGVGVAVLHSPTLKPFDEESVVAALGKGRLVLTAENHSVVGGLFDAVARTLVGRGIGERVTPIGLPDAFLDAGALPTLEDRYGVSTAKIIERIRELL
ncbi:transketolase family protein [Brachybacterium phenoliresistens]|uniref:Transketolase n=1 Tax=Brachybacterium phenoliresistens TaxID=396014 RepID=Z9JU42_9MICO|nr:transketolase C-terminal domain-containing protein [Brachybacterium phenoliresistens]EWS81719.1 transketolase [Brachybacterium phenoliresistens]